MVTYTSRNALHKPELADTGFPTHMNANADIIDAAIAKCTYTETADPGVGDDSADGYATGSIWLNATSDRWFVCEDPAAGAAVWRQIWPALPADIDIDTNDVVFGATSRILGRKTASGGAGEECTLSEVLDFVGSAAQGDILYRGSSTWARLGAGTKGQALITSGASANPQYIDYHSDIYRQLLINGDFQINQQAVSPYTSATTPDNSDDSYAAPDQWILLSDGNDIVDVYQKTTFLPPGAAAALLLEVETAGKKFGILQIVESKDAIKYAGQVASLQFKARTTTGKIIRNIRAAILSWTGTADAVTSDVVSAWNSEGSNPAWIANWTAENTPEDLALVADAWTTYRIENISIDTAGLTNLAVFIWCDDGDADVGDIVFISQVQLNLGPICLPYSQRSFQDELQKCMRFWQKTYAYDTPVGTAVTAGSIVWFAHGGTTWSRVPVSWAVPLRKSVVPKGYSPNSGTADKVYNASTLEDINGSGDSSSWICSYGSAGVSATEGNTLRVHCVADARL